MASHKGGRHKKNHLISRLINSNYHVKAFFKVCLPIRDRRRATCDKSYNVSKCRRFSCGRKIVKQGAIKSCRLSHCRLPRIGKCTFNRNQNPLTDPKSTKGRSESLLNFFGTPSTRDEGDAGECHPPGKQHHPPIKHFSINHSLTSIMTNDHPSFTFA